MSQTQHESVVKLSLNFISVTCPEVWGFRPLASLLWANPTMEGPKKPLEVSYQLPLIDCPFKSMGFGLNNVHCLSCPVNIHNYSSSDFWARKSFLTIQRLIVNVFHEISGRHDGSKKSGRQRLSRLRGDFFPLLPHKDGHLCQWSCIVWDIPRDIKIQAPVAPAGSFEHRLKSLTSAFCENRFHASSFEPEFRVPQRSLWREGKLDSGYFRHARNSCTFEI